MTDSTDDVDWYDGYYDTPKPKRRKTKPLSGTYRKFRHLDRVLRDCAEYENPIYKTAAALWEAIANANTSKGGGVK
jgi:hypothetical protein